MQFNNIRAKISFGLLIIFMSNLLYAVPTQKLSQAQYNELVQQYTAQVNATKQVLDEPNPASDVTTQKQAFCSRLAAYQQIADLSKANLELESANVTLMIANNFLARQKQSFEDSGMTEQVFCAKPQTVN